MNKIERKAKVTNNKKKVTNNEQKVMVKHFKVTSNKHAVTVQRATRILFMISFLNYQQCQRFEIQNLNNNILITFKKITK